MREPELLLANRHQMLIAVSPQVHRDEGQALAFDVEHQAAGVNLVVKGLLAVFGRDADLGSPGPELSGSAHAGENRPAGQSMPFAQESEPRIPLPGRPGRDVGEMKPLASSSVPVGG